MSKVYPNELEAQPEFEGFSEWLETFDLYRGKAEEETEDQNRSQYTKRTGANCNTVHQVYLLHLILPSMMVNDFWTSLVITIDGVCLL